MDFVWDGLPLLSQESLDLLRFSLAERGLGSLLPHIQSLGGNVDVLGPVEAGFLGLLVGPKLDKADLGREDPWSDFGGRDDALSVLLGHIAIQAPTLRSLGLYFPWSRNTPREMTQRFAEMASLVSLTLGGVIVLNDEVVQSIGRLPNLKHFRCPRATYEKKILAPLPVGSFPSLITIEADLEILYAASYGYIPAVQNGLSVHLRASIGPSRRRWSTVVCSTQFTTKIRNTLTRVEVYISTPRDGLEYPVVEPLLGCERLERLTLAGSLCACDLRNLKYVQKWAALKSLNCEPMAEAPARVGLDVVAILAARCPALEELWVPVDPALEVQGEISLTPFKNLRSLGVKYWKLPPQGRPREVLVGVLNGLKPTGVRREAPLWEFSFPPFNRAERPEWVGIMKAVDAVWFFHPQLQAMFLDPLCPY